MPSQSPTIRSMLARLGIERFLLSIHQLSFPAGDDDIGIGTPYSPAARRFLAFVGDLGFDGLSLGPAGVTSFDNPSPYDASLFSLNPTFISPTDLIDAGLVDASVVHGLRAHGDPRRVDHRHAWRAARRLIHEAGTRLRRDGAVADLLAAVRQDPRVLAEAAYEGAAAAHGTEDWRRWPAGVVGSGAVDAAAVDAAAVDDFLIGQALLRAQHARLREACRSAGLGLYADAQIGVSHRDRYLNRDLFLADYRIGAPPSRTNPGGQPWGYPVLDPAQVASADSGARRFLQDRFRWLLATHDGVRIDHPHGWVCPWVYREGAGDPMEAVRHGARLFESPDVAEHPALARYARVGAGQIDHTKPRYDDDWVTWLEPSQVKRYAEQIALLVDTGIPRDHLFVEVLSTCPKPLAAVLDDLGLGRFRVLQKARVDLENDVYRSDRAGPLDWVMVGNHDTPPLRRVIDGWEGTAEMARRAAYLARRLEPDAARREALERVLSTDTVAFAEAMLADCFIGPARRVILFWADLFGETGIYNRPGVVSDENWTLRVPPDFEAAYRRAVGQGAAPSLERALHLALHARGLD